MAAVNAKNRQRIIQFAWDQVLNNPLGIGNECTHIVYAALYESRSHDGVTEPVPAPKIQQAQVPYTWGEKRKALSDAEAGDIIQFLNQRSAFELIIGNQIAKFDMVRGPNHTGILFSAVDQYFFLQVEAHLTDPNTAKMRPRLGLVFHRPFRLIVTQDDISGSADNRLGILFSQIQALVNGNSFTTSGFVAILRDHALLGLDFLFDGTTVTEKEYKEAANAKKKQATWSRNGSPIRFMLSHSPSGSITGYQPQDSPRRGAMSSTQLADEKERLMKAMFRGGRQGAENTAEHSAGDHGDDKRERFGQGLFNWKSLP